MKRYVELELLSEVLYEELVKAYNAGYNAVKFGVWLVKEEGDDAESDVRYVEVDVTGVESGRDVVEICDCRACECFEEQMFGVEGEVKVRGLEELKRLANAVADIVRKNYDGGYEGHVEGLRRLGLDVLTLVPKPEGEVRLLDDW